MVVKINLNGYEAFTDFMAKEIPNSKFAYIYLYFGGSVDTQTLLSWCSDCAQAAPLIEERISKWGNDTLFVYVDVGSQSEWKDRDNSFKKDPNVKLRTIPTLIKWNSPKRLEGDQWQNQELVDLFFQVDSDDEI